MPTGTTRRTSAVTRARLQSVLSRALPETLAEVLLPAVRWRISRRTITALVPNQVWEDLFRTHAIPALEAQAFKSVESIKVACRLAGDTDTGLRKQTFANFYGDPGNEFPVSAARQVLDAPGLTHNPFYVHGPAGCGKSHLLHAMANEFRDMLGTDAVFGTTGEDWVARLAPAYADHDPELIERLDQASVVVLDDVGGLSSRDVAQEQFFVLLNNCLENGQQIVLSALVPPKRLADMEERLVTRFSWGLAVAIDQPKLETRISLLRDLAGPVLEDVDPAEIGQLVEALAPDMHHVMQLADRLLSGQKVKLGEDKASFDRVLEVVANHYGIRAGDIAGKRRHRAIALARQTALLLGRRLTGHNLEALGGMVGGRDHSTVLYLIRQAEERQQDDQNYHSLVTELTQTVLR